MTKTHAALQLLAHGPLAFRDFVAITGWPYNTCRRVIGYLQATGRAVWDGAWRLA